MPKRFTYDEVLKSVDKISNGQTKLISEEYVDYHTPLLFQCSCGNVFERSYDKFKLGRIFCKTCSNELRAEKQRTDFEYIKSIISKYGCRYISGEYKNKGSILYLQCKCGNYFNKSWGAFKNGQDHCPECGRKRIAEYQRKYYPENAEEIFLEHGYIMIGNFINRDTEVECICSKGHKCNVILSNLLSRNSGCHICGLNRRSGENHSNYKGGISILDHIIRQNLNEWKGNIRDLYNHKCPITGRTKLDTTVHHLYSLNSIINDVVKYLGIQIKIYDTVSNNNLSETDINRIISEILKRHDNTIGILIDKNIHKKFHKKYGYGNNTPEQFDEFLRDNYSLTLNQIMKV